jgi:mRNA-degrading endonuclease RelE of RelBE toxin-antitoxin system
MTASVGVLQHADANYRVIAILDDGVMLILLVGVGHRREAYR